MLPLSDQSNFGVILRDAIYREISSGKLKYKGLKARIARISIPEEYWPQILQMCNYRKYDRIKDPIEQMIESVVISGILKQILK